MIRVQSVCFKDKISLECIKTLFKAEKIFLKRKISRIRVKASNYVLSLMFREAGLDIQEIIHIKVSISFTAVTFNSLPTG